MEKIETEKAIRESKSRSEVCKKLGLNPNGNNIKKLEKFIEVNKIDISHFLSYGKYYKKYSIIKKECPVCKNIFQTKKDHPREKVVCSRACSNTMFRSGSNNGNYKDGENGERKHRKICFKYHKKECLVCGFDKVVEVHHIDENHENNDPKNLIPLCPNHHKMIHTKKYKQEVLDALK